MPKKLLLVFCLIIICASVWGFVEYFGNLETIRNPPVDIKALAAEVKDFPDNWVISIQSTPMSPGNPENMGEESNYEALEIPGWSKYYPDGSAEHWLLRVRNPYLARMVFFQVPVEFYLTKDLGKNEIEGYSYQSSVADSWQFACKNNSKRDEDRIICTALGRYDEFISIFSISAKRDQVTPEILSKILRSIDDRIAKALKR